MQNKCGAAIHAGYCHIDTAAQYQNEAAVAEGIRISGVDRRDVFITTKVWLQYCGYDKLRAGFENSLKRLGTDYVDLYLIHWPFVAEKHKKSVSQIMLKWAIQEGMAVIPKTTSVLHMVENLCLWDFELTDEDMATIRSVDTGKRLVSRTDPDDPESRARLTGMVFDI